jgi:hypothetical protein
MGHPPFALSIAKLAKSKYSPTGSVDTFRPHEYADVLGEPVRCGRTEQDGLPGAEALT